MISFETVTHDGQHPNHRNCLELWMKIHPTCPTCRIPLMWSEKGTLIRQIRNDTNERLLTIVEKIKATVGFVAGSSVLGLVFGGILISPAIVGREIGIAFGGQIGGVIGETVGVGVGLAANGCAIRQATSYFNRNRIEDVN